MTSTLQQEASRKLNLGIINNVRSAKTLRGRFITYMRTDGIDMTLEAVQEASQK